MPKLDTYLHLRLGGMADTLALSALGASLLLSSPGFAPGAGKLSILATSLAFAGSAYLANRLLSPWSRSNLITSNTGVRSSALPLRVGDVSNIDGMLLGYTVDGGEPVVLPYDDLMRHLFLLGQSGVGKTVFGKFLMMQQILRGGGMMFIDGKMKGSDLEELYHLCAWAGRAHDLLVINPGNPALSNSYSPLLQGDPDEVAARCLSLIPASEDNPGADHYRQSANEGLQVIIGAIQATGLAYSFLDLVILLRSPKALQDLERKLRDIDPASLRLLELRLFLDRYTELDRSGKPVINVNKMKDTFGGISGRLYSFASGKFGEVLNSYTPDVALYDAIRANKIVYVMLPTMGKNEQAKNFGKMVIGDLRTAVSWLQALPEQELPRYPYLVFCDEAGSYVSESWSRIFEQARSARVFMLPAVQTLANFETISPELKEMVIGNTWTKVIFKLGSQDSATQIADLIGMHRRVNHTLTASSSASHSAQQSSSAPQASGGDGTGGALQEREEEAYRVHPDQLKRLARGEALVFYGGEQVYNIVVPKLDLDPALIASFGPPRINHFSYPPRAGLDYGRQIDALLATS